MTNLSHAFTVKGDSRAIRFYLWLYEADPKRINTCKLFWAYIFAPLVLIFRLVAEFAAFIDGLIPRRPKKPKAAKTYLEDEIEEYIPPAPKQPSRFERILERVSTFLSSTLVKRTGQVIFFTIIGAWLIFLLVMIGIAIVTKPFAVLLGIGIVVAVLAIIAAGIALYEYRVGEQKVRGFFRLLGRLYHSVHDHTCARVVVED